MEWMMGLARRFCHRWSERVVRDQPPLLRFFPLLPRSLSIERERKEHGRVKGLQETSNPFGHWQFGKGQIAIWEHCPVNFTANTDRRGDSLGLRGLEPKLMV